MTVIRDAWFSFMIAILGVLTINSIVPFIPIDETRYLTVAWEMRLNHSFIVPLLNGLPYADKPPLLFWLINLDWLIFGVNEKTLRCLPLVFSLLNIVLVYKISIRLWNDKKVARNAAIIFSSSLIGLIWSALIMFDIILTFWILLGILGLIWATTEITPWILISLSVGGGLLTNGPVILIHVMPVALSFFVWGPVDKLNLRRWFALLGLCVSVGIAMALVWVIPAAIMGGEAYGKDLLWGQTVNRMVTSFAHQRPLWWYLPLLPAIFFPWFFVKPAWPGLTGLRQDRSIRFLMIWILSTLLLFSLISGKQIHYLIPMLAPGSLLMAKNMATFSSTDLKAIKYHYPIAVFYIVLGAIVLMLPWLKLDSEAGNISVGMVWITATGFILLGGIMLMMKISSMDNMIKTIALSSLLALAVFIFSGRNGLFAQHDVKTVSHMLEEKQAEGYKILHYGEYHGEYQFLGHLKQPLTVVKDKNTISNYIKTFSKIILITHEKTSLPLDEADILYQQLYRDKHLIIWKKEGIHHFLAGLP